MRDTWSPSESPWVQRGGRAPQQRKPTHSTAPTQGPSSTPLSHTPTSTWTSNRWANIWTALLKDLPQRPSATHQQTLGRQTGEKIFEQPYTKGRLLNLKPHTNKQLNVIQSWIWTALFKDLPQTCEHILDCPQLHTSKILARWEDSWTALLRRTSPHPHILKYWDENLSPAMGRGIDSRNRVWNLVGKLLRLTGRNDNFTPTCFLAPIALVLQAVDQSFEQP